jgi:hypothetical protein
MWIEHIHTLEGLGSCLSATFPGDQAQALSAVCPCAAALTGRGMSLKAGIAASADCGRLGERRTGACGGRGTERRAEVGPGGIMSSRLDVKVMGVRRMCFLPCFHSFWCLIHLNRGRIAHRLL